MTRGKGYLQATRWDLVSSSVNSRGLKHKLDRQLLLKACWAVLEDFLPVVLFQPVLNTLFKRLVRLKPKLTENFPRLDSESRLLLRGDERYEIASTGSFCDLKV